jgi:predicted secreted protein
MGELINGRSIILYKYDETTYQDIPFACATTASLSIQTDVREVTSQSSANYKEFTPDLNSWTISASGFTILNTQYNYLNLLGLITNRTMFTAKFVIDNGGVDGLSIFVGRVILTNYTLDGTDDQLSTYSVQLQGSGAYSLSGTIAEGNTIIIQSTTVQVFQSTTVEGQTSITFAGAIGLELLYASRGGIGAQPLFLLVGNGCTWDDATGTLTLATEAVEAENILILVQ